MLQLISLPRLALVAVCCALWAGSVPPEAVAVEYRVIVAAGEHDRQWAPVSVTLPSDEKQPVSRQDTVQMTGPDGKLIPAQLAEPGLLDAGTDAAGPLVLYFVVNDLPAGETREYTVKIGEGPGEFQGNFQVASNNEHTLDLQYVTSDDRVRPVWRYMFAPLDESSPAARERTFKVYHHVFDPAGERIVTKGPGGLYTHHRGLFFGFNKVTYGDGRQADVWHARGKAHQSGAGTEFQEAGTSLGRHRERVLWHGQEGEPFAAEQRELTAFAVPDAVLLEFASRVKTLGGPIKLDGDPQHAGFHFRADNEVADETKGETYYLRPDGAGAKGETRNWPKEPDHVNLPWNAMSFVLGDQRYTVLYMDRPENPKEARFSERDYGRFGSYFEYEVTEETPLEVNYRVLLIPGELDVATAARHHANFIDPPQVTLERQ